MTTVTHKFKVGQTVQLIPSISRAAASGYYQIISLRPSESDGLQYRVKSGSEAYERVVAESDLRPFSSRNFDD